MTGIPLNEQAQGRALPEVPQAQPDPLVWIVILAWNHYADTAECLASVLGLAYSRFAVLVVDNGSADETPARVRAAFPQVAVLELGANLGVPGGYNAGFRYALERGADYILMLNNDTTVSPDLLTHLVAAAAEPAAGILVPTAYYYHTPDKVWSAGARYRWFPPAIVMELRPSRQGEPARALEYAIGCCILISRAACEQVGLLDESYFFMWEDLDFSLRVRSAGMLILGVPEAALWHKVSQSTEPGSALFWQMHGRSGALFYRRHSVLPRLAMAVHLAYFALREFILKGRLRFLKPFLDGVRAGLAAPLLDLPRAPGAQH